MKWNVTELKGFVAASYIATEAQYYRTSVNAQLLDVGKRRGTIEGGKLMELMRANYFEGHENTDHA